MFYEFILERMILFMEDSIDRQFSLFLCSEKSVQAGYFLNVELLEKVFFTFFSFYFRLH